MSEAVSQPQGFSLFILSDGTGETAATMIRAALVQYQKQDIQITRCKNVRTEPQVESIIQDCFEKRGIIVYTVASPHMRKRIKEIANSNGVLCFDLLGPLL